MEELGEAYGDRVEIMAFPCNQFGGQEPGDAAQIKQFAKDHGFPSDGYLMAKVNVNGPKASEVWKSLKAHARPKPVKSVMWNYDQMKKRSRDLLHPERSGDPPHGNYVERSAAEWRSQIEAAPSAEAVTELEATPLQTQRRSKRGT